MAGARITTRMFDGMIRTMKMKVKVIIPMECDIKIGYACFKAPYISQMQDLKNAITKIGLLAVNFLWPCLI